MKKKSAVIVVLVSFLAVAAWIVSVNFAGTFGSHEEEVASENPPSKTHFDRRGGAARTQSNFEAESSGENEEIPNVPEPRDAKSSTGNLTAPSRTTIVRAEGPQSISSQAPSVLSQVSNLPLASLPKASFRLLAVGSLPEWREEIRDGQRVSLPDEPGSIPPPLLILRINNQEVDLPSIPLSLKHITAPAFAPQTEIDLFEPGNSQPWVSFGLSETTRALVVLRPGGSGDDWSIPRPLILPDDEQSFPLGWARIVNPDKLAIVAKIGKDPARWFRSESDVLWDRSTHLESVKVIIGIRNESNDSIRTIYSDVTEKDPAKRINIVIYKDEKRQAPAQLFISSETLSH